MVFHEQRWRLARDKGAMTKSVAPNPTPAQANRPAAPQAPGLRTVSAQQAWASVTANRFSDLLLGQTVPVALPSADCLPVRAEREKSTRAANDDPPTDVRELPAQREMPANGGTRPETSESLGAGPVALPERIVPQVPGLIPPHISSLAAAPAAAAGAAAASRVAQFEAISQKVLRGLQVERMGSHTALKVSLQGPNKAPIELDLRMEGGKVRASFLSADVSGFRMMEQARVELQQVLAASGVDVGAITVDLRQGGGDGGGARGRHHGAQGAGDSNGDSNGDSGSRCSAPLASRAGVSKRNARSRTNYVA